MALRKISFAVILASLVLVLAWTVFKWTRTPAAAEPVPVIASTGTLTAAELGAANDEEVLELGKELFTREWVAGDRRSHAGAGLGPVYNAQSCAACHRLGGIGGAGTNETNVSLVPVFVSEKFSGNLSGVLPEHPLPPADAPNKVVVGKRGQETIELEI